MSLKKATKTKEANRVELVVVIDAETFEKGLQIAYRKNVKKMNVPGFRKGKAPRAFVEKMYGKEIFYEDALNELYPDALDEAIKASGYEYVEDKIDFDVTSINEKGVEFKAVITVKPEVEISDYVGMKAERPSDEVKDEDVEEELKRLQDRQARLVSVEGRAAQDGDTAVIDYEGFADGVPFEGGKAEQYSLALGSNTFIPGFEDQIIGKEIGEEFDVNVTFPEEYHADELAGKPAVFKCKLHELKVREVPELDDEFAKDCSEFDTLDELKADMRAHLEEHRKADADRAFEDALAKQLGEKMKADIPAVMIENAMNDCVADFDRRLQSQGLSLDMYLQYTGMDHDAFRETTREQAEQQVKVRLALEKIVALENITVSDEELDAEYNKFAEAYGMKVEDIKKALPAEYISKDLSVEKAMHFVRDNAKVGKPAAKKTTAKKADDAAEKKPAAKKTTTKKAADTAEKKPAAKKTTAKKVDDAAAKKPAAKKTTTKKAADAAEKKPAAKKPAAKKTTTAKKADKE